MEPKVKKETVIRTVLTLVSLVNSILMILGKNVLPWEEEEISRALTAIFAVMTTIWSWWKNNSFTKPAIMADEYISRLKERSRKDGAYYDDNRNQL